MKTHVLRDVLRKNRNTILIYLALGITTSFLGSFVARYFATVVDRFTDGTFSLSMALFYGGALILLCGLNYLDNIPDQALHHGIYLDLKLAALKKISTIAYAAYQGIGTGQLVQRIENGAYAGRGILYGFWFRLIRELLPSMLFSMLFILGISKAITLTILAGYVVVFVITNVLLKALYKIKERILTNEEALNRYLVRGFMELVVFRLNKRFESEIRKADAAKGEIVASKVRMKMIHEAFFTLFALLVILIKIAIIVYAWQSKSLSIGEVVALITLTDGAYTPIAIFNVLYIDLKLDKAAFDRYRAFLHAPDDAHLTHGQHVQTVRGDVAFDRVACRYGERTVLRAFDLRIPNGGTVALVGESGSGKSTVAKLLTGLIKPCDGCIRVDGMALGDIALTSYYDHIFYITQDAPVFDGTLRENIVFDDPVDDVRIIEALHAVELGEWFSKMQDGLDTALGEKGMTLSGGERQRLALARLWFSDARIVVLDEATSAMDNLTERAVLGAIMRRLRGRTVIAIAHRLHTIQDFDDIVVMRDGDIVAQGTFAELLDSDAYFNALYQKEQQDA